MAVAKIEVQRFSVISSKPFENVIETLKGVGRAPECGRPYKIIQVGGQFRNPLRLAKSLLLPDGSRFRTPDRLFGWTWGLGPLF